uniref:Ig-like domain-containing protein n=1 Tax=Stegastes partitus TaxID=144197 RepID=A0A3B5B967_9TELE
QWFRNSFVSKRNVSVLLVHILPSFLLVVNCNVVSNEPWPLVQRSSSPVVSTEKLKVITPLKDTEAKEGQEIVLNCEVNAEGAKAKWLKNDETVFESSKYVMVQRDNVFSLRIKDRKDCGKYQISACNPSGTKTASTRVEVLGESPDHSQKHLP